MQTTFVVLPLYSIRTKSERYVPTRSGLNAWNARGRKRKFGEAYISVPSMVHRLCRDFFPAKDVLFELVLPDGIRVDAKLCQSGAKALMTNPNHRICEWLFMKMESDIERGIRYARGKPYSIEDLHREGIGCVKITAAAGNGPQFQMEPLPIGAYEDFIRDLLYEG